MPFLPDVDCYYEYYIMSQSHYKAVSVYYDYVSKMKLLHGRTASGNRALPKEESECVKGELFSFCNNDEDGNAAVFHLYFWFLICAWCFVIE